MESLLIVKNTFAKVISNYKIGDAIDITFTRFGNEKKVKVTLGKDPRYTIQSFEDAGININDGAKQRRQNWLRKK